MTPLHLWWVKFFRRLPVHNPNLIMKDWRRQVRNHWSGPNCEFHSQIIIYIYLCLTNWKPYSAALPTSSWRPVLTPGSFQLSSSDLPIQAVKLVQEQNLHFAFGDFDDHLEDVTIGKPLFKRSLSQQTDCVALCFTRLAKEQSMSTLMSWDTR